MVTKNIVEIPEPQVTYKNDEFIIKNYNCNIQFFPYYNARWLLMKEGLLNQAKEIWPDVPIYSIFDLADKKSEEDDKNNDDESPLDNSMVGKDVIIAGTLFKKLPALPNILKEFDDEKKMLEPQQQTDNLMSYASDKDILFLQEGNENIELKGDIKVGQLCTGICLAVKGQINPTGSGFIVEDVCHFSIPSKLSAEPKQLSLLGDKDLYVLIVSGLGFISDLVSDQKLTRSLNLLFEILVGNLPVVQEKTIVRVILAGNNISSKNFLKETSTSDSGPMKLKSTSHEAIQLLDKFLANIGQYMFADLMPGDSDLTNLLWPQQPLNPCLLPRAFNVKSIKAVTNPHRASYFGVDFLGTSGQNIDAIRLSTMWDDSIDIMRNVLEWGHIAPICPDVLNSYPFENEDPFLLTEYPDIFFAGNQKEFNMGTFSAPNGKNVKLISVPAFNEKYLGVMVNLRNLNCDLMAFN